MRYLGIRLIEGTDLLLDAIVERQRESSPETDQSEVVRNIIREHARRHGIEVSA